MGHFRSFWCSRARLRIVRASARTVGLTRWRGSGRHRLPEISHFLVIVDVGKYMLHGGGAGAALPPPQKTWLWCGATPKGHPAAPHHNQCAACACLAHFCPISNCFVYKVWQMVKQAHAGPRIAPRAFKIRRRIRNSLDVGASVIS